MKNRIIRTSTFVILLVFSIIAFNQSEAQDFPGKEVQLLVGKDVKAKEFKEDWEKNYHYKNFYKKFDVKNKKLDKFRTRPFAKNLYTEYSKLVGKEFKVKNYYETTERYIMLELSNDKIGTLFYEYDPKYERDYELTVIGGLVLPEDFYCRDIEKEVDKFTNKIKYNTPTENGMYYNKYIEDGSVRIYLYIRQRGSTVSVNEKGVILLLENGFKIEKPNASISVNVNTGGSGYMYSAMIEIDNNDIKLLLENKITDKRLYIYDDSVDSISGMKLKEYLKCLVKLEK